MVQRAQLAAPAIAAVNAVLYLYRQRPGKLVNNAALYTGIYTARQRRPEAGPIPGAGCVGLRPCNWRAP